MKPPAAAAARVAAQGSPALWALQARLAPYLFVAPFVVLFLVFTLWPVARSFILSFYESAGPREKRFIGLGNYRFLFTDVQFQVAALNTLTYTVLYLALYLPLSLGLALLLNSRRVWFRNVLRFAFFSTHLVGQVFVAIMFTLLLAPRQGLINRAIGVALPWVGSEIYWKSDPNFAMPAMVLASLWISVGYGMIYFLAALQTVDRDLYEAAAIDGAGRWARFAHVTLPGIRPVLVFLLLVGTIGALQLFELPYVFFDPPSGPGMRALTVVMYLYQQGFETGNIGYACAIGWVLALGIFLASMAQLRIAGATRDV
jgi:ABC-type sugar transport system permease subunit